MARAIVERVEDVEDVLRGVPGFRAYYALLTTGGTLATITVCDDQAGTAESTRRAAAWIRRNLAGVSVSPAEITEGEGSRVRIALNGVRAVFHRPHPQKETDKGAVRSMRRGAVSGKR